MHQALILLNRIFFDEYPNEALIKSASNTLRLFEADFIDGPFIDIGCGQSPFIVEHAMAKTHRIIYGIDEEETQIENLRYRLSPIPGIDLKNKIKLELKSFPKDKLPEEIFSVVVLSNFLHFFILKKCREIIEILKNHTTKGSLIYVLVHSKKHFYNNSRKPGNNKHFKHFFSQRTLHSVFNSNDFDTMFISESIHLQSKREKEIKQIWADSLEAHEFFRNANQKNGFLQGEIHDKKSASIEAIFRRK